MVEWFLVGDGEVVGAGGGVVGGVGVFVVLVACGGVGGGGGGGGGGVVAGGVRGRVVVVFPHLLVTRGVSCTFYVASTRGSSSALSLWFLSPQAVPFIPSPSPLLSPPLCSALCFLLYSCVFPPRPLFISHICTQTNVRKHMDGCT